MGDSMSKSILVKEYNKANIKNKDIKSFTQTVDVSFLDILKASEIEVIVKDYVDCACKDSVNLKEYFVECSKCNAKGYLVINSHQVTCNECKGEKYIRVHDCYVCNNESKVLKDVKVKIKLNEDMKNNDEIILNYDDHKLILKLNIYNKDDYLIKGKDVYLLKSVNYTKEDFNNKVVKEIETFKGIKKIKSEFKVRKEIVKLVNEGIDEGDFYFIFENEVENEKEVLYTNVLIDKTGYVNVKDLINNKVVVASKVIPLNANGYFYVDDNISEYSDDKYLIKFNKFDLNQFEITDDYSYVINLEKEDVTMDKKTILINGEKVNVNFKKNLKEVIYAYLENKGFVNKEGKKEGIKVKIVPYVENVYKISIKNNKKIVYLEDYKYDDYRLVETFKKSDYLYNYLKVDKEEEIYIGNDLILIKRV